MITTGCAVHRLPDHRFNLWMVSSRCVFRYAIATRELYGPVGHLFSTTVPRLLPLKFSNSLDYIDYTGSFALYFTSHYLT